MKLLAWLKQPFSPADSATSTPRRSPRHRLNVETLEDRITPAITITLDYSLDTNGFFADGARRATLQTAVDAIGSQLNDSLTSIVPSGGDSWFPQIFNPTTGASQVLNPLNIAQNEIRVFVGGRNLAGNEAGEGGTGGAFRISGSNAWIDRVLNRGQGDTQGSNASDFAPWGGSIAFDTNANWYFGTDPNGIGSNQLSFYSVAQHELGHVLGFGTADSYSNKVSGNFFVGSTAVSLFGSAVPLPTNGDTDHFNQNVTFGGVTAAMAPVLTQGDFTSFTTLDFGALADIGWRVSNLNFTPPADLPPVGNESPGAGIPLPEPGGVRGTTVFAVGTEAGNAPHVQVFNADGTQRFSFYAYTENVTTGVRVSTGDVNGDGFEDIITSPGAGAGPHVKVFDGQSGQEIRSFFAYAPTFANGVYIATGDVNGDGFDDIITGAGAGGGPHVKVFDGFSGAELQSFFAYVPNYAGGVVVASGDIDGNGRDDIITGTGPGAPGHVRALDGLTLAELKSFFAFIPSFTGGLTLAAGDIDSDGFDDIVTAAGAGGGPHVQAFSGRTDQTISSFFAGPATLPNGIKVSVEDVNGDGQADFVTGLGAGAVPQLTIYSGANQSVVLDQFFPYAINYLGGFSIG